MYPVPIELLSLYRHWKKHADISSEIRQKPQTNLNSQTVNQMTWFVDERMKIWHQKYKNKKPPFIDDKVLSNFRFCNVYRELDRQTIEIHRQCLSLRDNFPLWLLNIAFHRFVCRPETVDRVGFLSLDKNENQHIKDTLFQLPRPIYGTAYVFPVSILKTLRCPNRETFFCDFLPSAILKVFKVISKFNDISVAEALPIVTQTFGANFNFYFTEILIDVAYQYPELINLYHDFPIGPGSIPTMKQLKVNSTPLQTCISLVSNIYQTDNLLQFNNQPILLSAENWEGVGCEVRKYNNLINNSGRHRLYRHAHKN